MIEKFTINKSLEKTPEWFPGQKVAIADDVPEVVKELFDSNKIYTIVEVITDEHGIMARLKIKDGNNMPPIMTIEGVDYATPQEMLDESDTFRGIAVIHLKKIVN